MKNIFLITICSLLCYNTWGQCPPNQVSTNPANPFNEEVGTSNPAYLNYFDWQTETYNPAGYVRPIVNSPFEEDENAFYYDRISTNSRIKDYYVEDGWELLNENITNSSINNPVDIISFTFYNKYSSMIRVLFAMEESSHPFQFVSVKLKFSNDDNINGMLHPMGNVGQPLDKKSIKNAFVSLPMATNEYYFMIADFHVEYDPCVCFKEDLADIKISFELLQQQSINLTGTSLSIDTDIADIANGTGDLDIERFLMAGTTNGSGNVNAGTLVFQSIERLIAEYETLKGSAPNYSKKLENLAKAKRALSIIAATASVTAVVVGTGGVGATIAASTPAAVTAAKKLVTNSKANAAAFKATADIAKGLSPFADFLSYQAKAEISASNAAINNIGSVGVNFGTLSLNGTITTQQLQSTTISMGIPGGAGTTPADFSASRYPKYDNVLGRIAVLETPEVKIGREESLTEVEPDLYHLKKTDRIIFDASTFDYVFNPAAGIIEDETVIFAGFEIVTRWSGLPRPLRDKFYNVDGDFSSSTVDGVTFESEFVPLSCIADLGMQLEYLSKEISTKQAPYYPYQYNFGEYTIEAVNIKLVINYSFDQIGRSGANNRAVQIITYPTKIVEMPYEEISAPTSNNGNPIPTVLELNGNQSYTTDRTIFAWEKVVIDANLTTANGVNVEIIAPEIIVKGGNIGSGIRLKQGFYPNDCSPHNPADPARVASFCDEGNYQANQSKYPRSADNTPTTEKPQTPVAFQAYPNPFTNTFNIEFELETEGETSLVVYDALGRVVETVLMNDNLASGQHQYQISGENLESGLYYATLQHSGGTQTIKIMKQ